jgi:hypothetical protein
MRLLERFDTNNSTLTIAAGKAIDVTGFAGEVLTGGGSLAASGDVADTGVGNVRIDNGTTLSIATGGTFNLQTDAGIEQGYGAGGLVLNAGTLEKTAGTGVSTISTPLNNTGTVMVNTGTLDITGAVSQVNGTTLEAGTWSVTGTSKIESTLMFAAPASLTAIGPGATVTLTGPNSAFTNVAGINTNAGSFSLSGGQSFMTIGPFTNSGTLNLGAGDTFSVAGSYAETAGSLLNDTIAGTSASGLFGQINSTGSATPAGTLNVTVAQSVTPKVGDAYPLIAYSSHIGSFSMINGLSLPDGEMLVPSYNAKNFALTVTSSSDAASPADVAIGAQTGEPTGNAVSAPQTVNSSGASQGTAASQPARPMTARPSRASHPSHSRPFHAVTRAPVHRRKFTAAHPEARNAIAHTRGNQRP